METIDGDEARDHIDLLARKYTGADFQAPVGQQGRVKLVIEPHHVVTSSE